MGSRGEEKHWRGLTRVTPIRGGSQIETVRFDSRAGDEVDPQLEDDLGSS